MIRSITAVFVLALAASPAWAQDCGPLKQIASVAMTPSGARMTVPVSINGSSQQMLLNTAGGITSLQQSAVDALGLHAIDGSRIKMLYTNGDASKSYVQVADFGVGAIRSANIQFIVRPAPPDGSMPAFAGTLAGDFLALYDVEMDFAGRKLNFFAKDHCPGHVLYWNPTAVAVLPITLQAPTADNSRTGFRSYSYRGNHIWVPVTLQDKPFQAALDTSSATSTMSAKTAKFIFGVTVESPGAVPLASLDGDPGHATFGYTFPSLTFDTVTVTNARFRIIPDLVGARDPNNSVRTDSRVHHVDDNIGADISIGMDVLKKLRLYVAYGEKKLYITPATAPAAQAASATP